MRRLRILLVEDDAAIAALLAEILVEMGHEALGPVDTEDAAVAAAARHEPDLMLVDRQLRRGDGVAAMAAILRRAPVAHVYMTGGSRLCLPAGAIVLVKPFGRDSLASALATEARRSGLAARPDP